MTLQKGLFWVFALFTLIAPTWIGIAFHEPSTVWVVALCGAFVTFLTKIDEIAELSLGPVKAKMKEAIKEANASVEQLQSLAASSSKATLTSLMASSFMGGTTFKAKAELHDQIVQTLRKLGLTDAAIRESEEMWRRGIGVIYHRAIRSALEGRTEKSQVNVNASDEVRKASSDFQALLRFSEWGVPSPREMRDFISGRGLLTPQLEEWISDFEHYQKTGEIRRFELFCTQ